MREDEELPLKSRNKLKKVLMLLDNKQYTKGLKQVNQLIAIHPGSASIISLKSMLLYRLDLPKESIPLCETAVILAPESLVAWERLGYQYENQWEYEDALRCYEVITRLAPVHKGHLRTYASLLMQMRRFDGYFHVSKLLLEWDNRSIVNWVHYLMALYFTGRMTEFVQSIDLFLIENRARLEKLQISELQLAKISILIQIKQGNEALVLIDQCREDIRDRLAHEQLTMKGKLLIGDISGAVESCLRLISRNPDNAKYVRKLISVNSVLGIPPEKTMKELAERYPNSNAILLEELKYASKERFQALLEGYIQSNLRKGVPALGSDLRPLYHYPEKVPVLDTLIKATKESLSHLHRFPNNPEIESPLTVLWGVFLCSQHFLQLNALEPALQCIDECIAHTPTIPDLYLFKSKLLRKSSRLPEALETRDSGRSLDFYDRYLNYKTAKFHLLLNDIEGAHKLITPFCISAAEPGLQYHENQDVKYELRIAEALMRQGDVKGAGNQFLDVEEHFRDMYTQTFKLLEDVELRLTLRWFFGMMKASERLFASQLYLRAGKGFLKCFFAGAQFNDERIGFAFMKRLLKFGKSDEELMLLLFEFFLKLGRVYMCAKALIALKRMNSEKFYSLKPELLAKTEGNEMRALVFTRAFQDSS